MLGEFCCKWKQEDRVVASKGSGLPLWYIFRWVWKAYLHAGENDPVESGKTDYLEMARISGSKQEQMEPVVK
jgi:hypothetical protein